MHGPITSVAEWILGAMALGIALSALGLSAWWAAPDRHLGWLAWLGRGALSAFGLALVWLGLMLLSTGTENLLFNPLRRWSGAPMVPELWFVLELWARDLVWSAAHAHKSGYLVLAGLTAAAAVVVWLTAKATLVLSGFVGLWAFLGY